MSSAILYAAIVAIWACVLIPRWLKRDSARSAAASAAAESSTARPDEADTTPAGESIPAEDTTCDDEPPVDEAGRNPGPAPVSPQESRRRVLKARRRLLWMLGGLTVAAYALAGTALAAWWVTVPPTVMLAGYLLLLREAGRADAEAGRREHEALEARQAARARERARRAGARASAATAPAVPVTYAAAPVAADYDDEGPGRDFTLDRRYAASSSATASRLALAADDDDADDDEYTENRLRAVGD